MTRLATAFDGMSDDEVRQEMRKHFDEHGRRLYEVDNEEAFERSVARDCQINVITYALWKENVAGLKRIGIDTTAYEAAGPVLFGGHRWEHPPRSRMAKRPGNIIAHDDRRPGHRRLCGQILAVR